MRIRYAYKLANEDGTTKFVVLNHIKSEQEVQELYADKGCIQATFHDRVRTGFRLDAEGNLVETGLVRKAAEEPAVAPAAPKAKKSSKKSKKQIDTNCPKGEDPSFLGSIYKVYKSIYTL